jgi:hypothetical protein
MFLSDNNHQSIPSYFSGIVPTAKTTDMPLDRGPSPFTPSHRRFEAMSPLDNEVHPVFHAGRVAVITGAASGIGKAAAVELAKCVGAIALDPASEILTNVICLR